MSCPSQSRQDQYRRFVLNPRDGGPVNEYRYRAGRVQFRILHSDGPGSKGGSRWRTLTEDDVALHVNLFTSVGSWFLKCRSEG